MMKSFQNFGLIFLLAYFMIKQGDFMIDPLVFLPKSQKTAEDIREGSPNIVKSRHTDRTGEDGVVIVCQAAPVEPIPPREIAVVAVACSLNSARAIGTNVPWPRRSPRFSITELSVKL